jgi:hypothetical protein
MNLKIRDLISNLSPEQMAILAAEYEQSNNVTITKDSQAERDFFYFLLATVKEMNEKE